MKYLQHLPLGLFISSFLLSCATMQEETNHTNSSTIEFREADNGLEKGYVKMLIEGSDEVIYVGDKIISAGDDVQSMESGFGVQGRPQIVITLTKKGQSKFSAATKRLVKKYIAVLANGKVVMAPFVQEQLETDTFVISGDLTLEEIDKIVSDFNQSQ